MISAVIAPHNLLIVDDERAQLQTLQDIFSDEGFDVCACATSEEALQRCREQSFAAMILDLRLGGQDGIELLSQIRQCQPGIRTIIHTAYGSFDSARDAVNLGAFAYVEKLGDPADLVSQVHRAVEDRLSEALTQSEQRYRDLLNDVVAIVWERDLPSWRFTFVSQPAESILGYPITRWMDEANFWVNHFHADDRERCVKLCADYAARGEDHEFDHRAIAADGRIVWLHDIVHVVKDESGTPTRLRGVMFDITEEKLAEEALRESEEKFRVLTERSSAIVLITRDERIVYCNPLLATLTGYSSDELRRMNFLDIVHPKHREVVAAGQRRGASDELHPNHFEIKIVTKYGEDRWLDLSAQQIEFEARPAELITCVNITERKLSERLLHEMQEQLAHVSRLSTMGEMVAGIAHEINQPLAAIANFALACKNTVKATEYEFDVPIETWLQQVNEQSVRCGDIIRGLRDFVKKNGDDCQSVDLSRVVRDSVALIQSDLRHQSVIIKCHSPHPGPRVHASQVQLQQVLVNLLRNGCDATSKTTAPEIGVHLECQNGGVRLTVSDNGPGVEESERKKLFDAFYTTKTDGMGMGLAISKSIVEAHGGSLRYEPGSPSGSKFHIELPTDQAATEYNEHAECRIN